MVFSVVNDEGGPSANLEKRHNFLGNSNSTWTYLNQVSNLHLLFKVFPEKLVRFQNLIYVFGVLRIGFKLELLGLRVERYHFFIPLTLLCVLKLMDRQGIIKFMSYHKAWVRHWRSNSLIGLFFFGIHNSLNIVNLSLTKRINEIF